MKTYFVRTAAVAWVAFIVGAMWAEIGSPRPTEGVYDWSLPVTALIVIGGSVVLGWAAAREHFKS